jgi:hypothetical protein
MERLVALSAGSVAVQAEHALDLVTTLASFEEGLGRLRQDPSLLFKLCSLVHSHHLGVCRQSLACMAVVADSARGGYTLVHQAATSVALDRTSAAPDRAIPRTLQQAFPTATTVQPRPFSCLVKLLSSVDLPCKTNALALINVLTEKAPAEQLPVLLSQLREAGLFLAVKQQACATDPDFREQLQIFQVQSRTLITLTRSQGPS